MFATERGASGEVSVQTPVGVDLRTMGQREVKTGRENQTKTKKKKKKSFKSVVRERVLIWHFPFYRLSPRFHLMDQQHIHIALRGEASVDA